MPASRIVGRKATAAMESPYNWLPTRSSHSTHAVSFSVACNDWSTSSRCQDISHQSISHSRFVERFTDSEEGIYVCQIRRPAHPALRPIIHQSHIIYVHARCLPIQPVSPIRTPPSYTPYTKWDLLLCERIPYCLHDIFTSSTNIDWRLVDTWILFNLPRTFLHRTIKMVSFLFTIISMCFSQITQPRIG